jgi:diphthamide synthase (EF-2-diphthine--ammonia ligase)
MTRVFGDYLAAGVTDIICGDLFLEDIRRYREERLFGSGRGVFPLWGEDTTRLARRFLELGFRAVLCCVDTRVLPADFAGRLYDEDLLADLPPAADPCGENGEFHTFVYDGPNFARPVAWTPGERTLREERFSYADLVPADSDAAASRTVI